MEENNPPKKPKETKQQQEDNEETSLEEKLERLARTSRRLTIIFAQLAGEDYPERPD